MLAIGRYAQWQSRFLRYIDTSPNDYALRKCIIKGPYTPTIVTTPAVPATEDSPAEFGHYAKEMQKATRVKGTPRITRKMMLIVNKLIKYTCKEFRTVPNEIRAQTLEPLEQNDSFAFVHELKQEMHADLKYVESLEDEIESDKAENIIKHMRSLNYNAYIFIKLGNVTVLHKCFLKKLNLNVKKQLKNNTTCQRKSQMYFERNCLNNFFEIQDLKAQLQDKNIAISELKKLIEKCKGKSVDTKFDKPSVVRQPNAQRIPLTISF
ncbi:hypothetical protein Tco_1068271 [Tanacetum coccineum]|uniref:Uncharacterized protein n=1 Tax=Tanacetum coccineum TaxID=301880 RepID=A0ABQ5HG38_9ASTR